MELRHLRYFVAVAEELHFSRAAKRLHMAQPPLSQQIRQLEEEIGVALLWRTKRQVRLTEAGRLFLQEARQILRQADQAVLTAQRAYRGKIGRLSIGFVGTAAYQALPHLLQKYRQQFPQVALTLQEITTTQEIVSLIGQEFDIGFLRPPVMAKSLHLLPLWPDSFVVALPDNHPLTRQTSIPLAGLADESFILSPPHLESNLYNEIVSLCQQEGFTPRVAQEAIQVPTILGLVAIGVGIALLPASIQKVNREGVVYRPLQISSGVLAPPALNIVLAWKNTEINPAVDHFVALAQTAVAASLLPADANTR